MSIRRLIVATVRILTGHNATVSKAPTIEIDADNQFLASSEATVEQYPATEISARKDVALSIIAKLVAYNRAAGVYIKGIAISRLADLVTAASAVFRGIKDVALKRTSGLIAAAGAICKSIKVIPFLRKSVLIIGRAFSLAFTKGTKMGKAAGLLKSDASEIAIEDAQTVARKSCGSAHNSKVAKAERTLVVSVLFHLRSNLRAEVGHISEIAIGRIASAGSAVGVVFRSFRSFVANHISSVVQAASVLASSVTRFINGKTATASSGYAESVFLDIKTKEESTGEATTATALMIQTEAEEKETHSANLAFWFAPEIIDGILYVYQAFSGVQDYDCLEMDCEDESVYWANAIVDGDCLRLTFASEATKDNDDLEVV